MCEEAKVKKAITYLLKILTKREYSVYDLREKLASRYEENVAEQALNYALEHNYASDERYSEMFTRYRANNHYGAIKIRYDLQQKEIDESIIDAAIDQCEINFQEKLEEYFSSKFDSADLADFKLKAKIFRNLLNRGYSSDEINTCFEHFST